MEIDHGHNTERVKDSTGGGDGGLGHGDAPAGLEGKDACRRVGRLSATHPQHPT
jgi:hypothetical protein